MDILKAFNIDGENYEVNIQGTDDEPLFQANQIGRLLGLTNIRATISVFDEDEKVVNTVYTLGGLQETTFLTEIGLYRLLGMSRKPIARTFQKWVCHVVREIRKNGKYELQKQHEVNMQLMKKHVEDEKHTILVEAFKFTPCVYIMKIFDDDTIVKIGESDDIQKRLQLAYGEYNTKDIVLLDCIPCITPHGYEQYLLKEQRHIASRRMQTTEFVKLDDFLTLSKLQDIMRRNSTKYESKYLSNEGIKAQEQDSLSKERLFIYQQIVNSQTAETREYWEDKLNNLPKEEATQQQTASTSSSPLQPNRRVYKYNLTDLSNPIAEFISLKEAARSVNNHKIHDYHIREACLHNTEFQGFRWFYVDNDEMKPDTIPATSEIAAKPLKRLGLIAKINREKDTILGIYQTQKDAAADVKVKPCAITFSLTNNTICSGFSWKLYDDCDDDLKKTFEGEVPDYKQPDTCNKSVQRIDPQTKEVVESFSSLQDACSKFATCHKTIKKYSDSGDIYKGFIWRLSS